jgi:glutamine synthetase
MTASGDMRAALLKQVEQDCVELVRFAYCDLAGISRCKAVHVSQLEHKLVEGVSLSRAQMALNVVDDLVAVGGMEPVGEIRLIADPGSYALGSEASRSATLWCNQVDHDGRDWGACPRSFLQATVAELADRGITVRASFEVEFYLAQPAPDGLRALPRTPVYSLIGHDASAPILLDIVRALVGQHKEVEQAINEYGPGQQEVTIRHAPAVKAADDYLTVKDTIRGVARAHGLAATFAPKPFIDQIGSGAHIHLSLWAGEEHNLLHDPAASDGLSDFARCFIAGIRCHLPALVAVTAPSANSYRRLSAGAWASSSTAWGFDNREAALRVASPFYGREKQTYNLEYKPIDAAANPYLALGGILRAGLDGVDRQAELPPPALVDPHKLSPAERTRLDIRELPTSLTEALRELQTDHLPLGSGETLLCRAFTAVRSSEAKLFSEHDEGYELMRHQDKY